MPVAPSSERFWSIFAGSGATLRPGGTKNLTARYPATSQVLTRRSAILLCSGAAASLAFAPGRSFAQDGFKFGLTPVFLSNDLELLAALRAYLTEAIGEPVELVSRRTYQEITALLVSGQLHAAWICGYPYVQFKADLDLVATPSWHGQPRYQSYLIVAADRHADTWEDIKGDMHAFSDPDSNSGFLVTRALLAENGLRPEGFFSRTFYTYGHRNVIRAVASGLAQSGSVDGYVWDVMREMEPGLVGQTRILRRSEWLGFPPVASPKALAGDPRIARLKDALTAMDRHAEGRKVLSLLRLDGFLATEPELFDTIAAKVDVVRRFG
jgi:phosphonate transport system substrate-binding protein